MSRDLPFNPNRQVEEDFDLHSSRLPVTFRHPTREIDDAMDDIIYNAIGEIQDRARDNELRTFFFNMMADRGYDNREFEKLCMMIADVVEISVHENKFRDARDAVVAVTEEIITMSVAYQVERYRELRHFVDRSQENDIARSINLYHKYNDAIDAFVHNGRHVNRSRRDRDDRDDRRDYGRDARGPARRDRWERGAVREGVHGSRRDRDDRSGSSRFDDVRSSDRNRNEREREERPSSSRFADDVKATRSHIQRMPGRDRDADIDDALASELEAGSTTKPSISKPERVLRMSAYEHQDAWLPSLETPHPYVVNHTQELVYVVNPEAQTTVPEIVNKENIVEFYAHENMAFGKAPKDMTRYDLGGVPRRLSELHDALINPTEEFQIEGREEKVTYHRRLSVPENTKNFSLKESMLFLNYRRFVAEMNQPNGANFHPVEIMDGASQLVEPFLCNEFEHGLLEELRGVSSFTKMNEKVRQLSKKVRPDLFLQIDRHLTTAVNRMMRQYLSIPALFIDSFTSDWLELFQLITEQYGDGFRNAINEHQEREIKFLMNHDVESELFVLTQLSDTANIKPFVVSMPTKLIYLKEVSFNLDLEMVPDVASQILPESNPFFHDLTLDLLTKNADNFGRFFIQTADLRVIEASRSWLNDKALLLRVIR